MKFKAFLTQVDHDKLHQAIQSAERGTAARIIVYITHKSVADPLAAAKPVFRELQLETAHQKTGFLLFVAPKSRKFAVLGGTALHEKLGQSWWDHLVHSITGHFKEEHYTAGLLSAVAEAGETFRKHFPSDKSRSAPETDIYDR